MSHYNMEDKFQENYKYNIESLCNELYEEINDPNGISARDKIKNTDKTGIVDKLSSKLHFDINNEIAGKKGNQERMNALKIVKLLYMKEKTGNRTRIIDILAKPRLDNIKSEFSSLSEYGDLIDDIEYKLRNVVSDYEDREQIIYGVNNYWEYLTDKLLDYVSTNNALENKEDAIYELDRIYNFFRHKVLEKLNDAYLRAHCESEGVLETFSNILCYHRNMCNDYDRININYQSNIEDSADDKYIETYKKYENYIVQEDTVVKYINRCLDDSDFFHEDSPESCIVTLILYLICHDELLEDDFNHVRFATKYYRVVINWLKNHTQAEFENGLELGVFVSVIQEIIDVKRKDDRYKNDFFGNKYTAKPLLSALKKPDKAQAMAVEMWVKRVQNRMMSNLDGGELIKRKRDIENTIFEIKKVIYNYHNIHDMEDVNNIIIHFCSRSLISRKMMYYMGDEFNRMLFKSLKKLNPIYNEVRIDIQYDHVSVFDMYREMERDVSGMMEDVANRIALNIHEFFIEPPKNEYTYVAGKTICIEMDAKYSTGKSRHFNLRFLCHREIDMYHIMLNEPENKRIMLQNFWFFETADEDESNRMKRLGLDKFLIE